MLKKLQNISETTKTPITYHLNDEYIWITFDESVLKEAEHKPIQNRIGSLDLNPNYIAFTVQDFKGEESSVIHKQVFDLSTLNKSPNNNKIKYEVLEISKSISNLCKHYQVEVVGFEILEMVKKDLGRGRYLNRLINNTWKKDLFVKNLQKRLNIVGIRHQEIACQYSSTIGCLQYPDEVDSVAAAVEIGRRTYVFSQRFLKKHKDFLDRDIVFPPFVWDHLKERWNSILSGYNPKRKGWKSVHEYLKEQKKLTELRFLFKDYDFSRWSCFSLKSDKSGVLAYSV